MTTDLKILQSLVFTCETTLIDIPTFERKDRELKRYIARLNSESRQVVSNLPINSIQHPNIYNIGDLLRQLDMTVNNNIITMYMNFTQGALEDVPVTLDTKKINQFPTKKYCECDNLEDDTCAICQIKYTDDEQLTILPCNGHHRYHTQCIEEWLSKFSKNCPSCRQNLDETGANESIQ